MGIWRNDTTSTTREINRYVEDFMNASLFDFCKYRKLSYVFNFERRMRASMCVFL